MTLEFEGVQWLSKQHMSRASDPFWEIKRRESLKVGWRS